MDGPVGDVRYRWQPCNQAEIEPKHAARAASCLGIGTGQTGLECEEGDASARQGTRTDSPGIE